MKLLVTPFFDATTHSYSYVLVEPASRCCAVIDPVLNFDLSTGKATTESADQIVAFVKANDLIVEWLLETHVHADHLSAARYLKSRFVCAQLGIGEGVRDVHALIGAGLPEPDESSFDRLFCNADRLAIGHACGRVFSTPGHTPGCVAYRFEDLVFVGDALFMPDYGTGRCDFPGGNARVLYRSIQKILSLPGTTKLFMCHDYGTEQRAPTFVTSVAAQCADNRHVRRGINETEFVQFRSERDKTLDLPDLMNIAVPFNLAGGRLAPMSETLSGMAA